FSGRARHRRDFHIVPIEIKTGLNEKPAKPHVDPGRCSDAATLNHLEIPSPGSQVLMHDKKPVHALSLRTEQLDALPLRKGGERRMSGSANEVDRARAQCGVSLVDRKNQLELDFEPLTPEETEFDRCNGREVGVRNHVRYGKLHRANPSLI